MNIIQANTTEEFVSTSTEWISGVISEAIRDNGKATVGLSGGSTPKPIYTMLAINKYISWEKVQFFLTDERYIPANHEDSNQKMIRETLLTREAKDAEFFAPKTELLLSKCVEDYASTMKSFTHPDLVILGMGDDGHIASLFPPVPPEAFGPALVLHTETAHFAVKDRISVTFPALLHAKKRLFLLTGKTKRELLKKMQSENEDVSLYPAQYLFDNRTTWIVR